MSFELVGIRLVADNAARYITDVASGQKATDVFSASTATAATKVNVFDDSLKKIKIQELTNKLSEQQKALEILQKDLTDTSAKYGEGSQQAAKKALAVDKLSNSIGITEQKIEHENATLAKEKEAFDASAHAATTAAPQVEKLGQETQQAGDKAAHADPQFKSFSEIAIGALRQIGAMAVQYFAQAAGAAVGFFKDSISAAGDFQQNFAEFGNAVGHTIDGTGLKLDDFKKQFISLGKELPVSTADVEKAAIEMARGGIDPAVIAGDGLRRTIQFASASMKGDLVGAAQISAKTMQAWTKNTDDAKTKTDFLTHAQDLMTQATTAASTTVDQLFLGLSNVGGTARLAGASFDETVKALAQLTPSFASSADAGTSLKTFFTRLQPETKPAIAAMQSLGLWSQKTGSAFYDAQGKFVGVAKAEDLLHNATKNLTDAQRQAVLQQIFGNDAIRAAAVFADQGAEGYNALSDSIAKQTTLTEAAKNNQSTFNTAMENFHGSIEALQITIGSALLPVLTTLFNQVLAPAINTVTTLTSALFGDNDAFNQLSPTLQSVVTFVDSLMTSTGGLSGIWTNDLQPAIEKAGAYFTENIQPILSDLATAIFPLVNAAIQILAGFWTDVLLPALHLAWDAFNTLILPVIKEVAAWLAVNLPPAIKATSDFFTGTLFPAIHTIYDFLDTNIIPIFKTISDWLTNKVPAASASTSDFWTNILQPALNKVWDFINTKVVPILKDVVTWLRDNIPPAAQKVADFWNNTLWPALNKVWDFVDKHVIPIFKALADVFSAILGKATSDYVTTLNIGLKPAFENVSKFINDSVIPDFEKTRKQFDFMADGINKVLGPPLQWLGETLLQGINDDFNNIISAIDTLVGWLHTLADTIRNMPSLPGAYKGSSPPPMANWMNMIADGAGNAAKAFDATRTSIHGLPASPAAMYAAGNTTNATYNQQRTVNLAYHTPNAPPASTSLAIANALAY